MELDKDQIRDYTPHGPTPHSQGMDDAPSFPPLAEAEAGGCNMNLGPSGLLPVAVQ